VDNPLKIPTLARPRWRELARWANAQGPITESGTMLRGTPIAETLGLLHPKLTRL
jgi:hypothetical protein